MLNMTSTFYELLNLQFICRDSYGHFLFQYDLETCKENEYLITELHKKILKYNSLNPVNRLQNFIKFNDTKHKFKTGENYDVIFFISSSVSEKDQKTYINLHISDVIPKSRKPIKNVLTLKEL